MGDNSFGIQVFIDAAAATEGAREFKRSAEDIAQSAKHAEDGISGLKEHMEELGGSDIKESLEGIEGALGKLNTGLKALGIGAVIVEFKELFEVGKELEDALIHLQIASGQTDEGMEQLKDATQSLSNAFGQSQIKVAAAQLEAAKSGFQDVTTNTQVASAALELAKTSFNDVGASSKTLTEVMQAYGQSADQAGKTSAQLFIATSKGKIDVAELGATFARSSEFIRESGISTKETLATFSTLGQIGVPVRSAMVGVSALLRDVAGAVPAVNKNFQDIQGTLHSFGIQAATLKDLVGQQGLVGAMQTLFKVAGGNQDVFNKLLGNPQAGAAAYSLITTGAEKYAKTIEDLTHAQELQAAADEKITNSTAYQAEQFRSKVQNAFISLASSALEALLPVFQFLNKNFDGLRIAAEAVAVVLVSRVAVSAIAAAAGLVTQTIASISAASAAVALAEAETVATIDMETMTVASVEVTSGIGAMAVAEGAATVATEGMATAIAALGGPITVIVGALALAAAAWYKYGDASKNAARDADTLKADLDRLQALGKTSPDIQTTDDYGKLKKERESALKQQKDLEDLKAREGRTTGGARSRFGDVGSGFSEDDQKKLDLVKERLKDVNEQLERYDKLVDESKAPHVDDTDNSLLHGDRSKVDKTVVDGNQALANVYKSVYEQTDKVAEAQDGLQDISLGLAKTVGGITLQSMKQYSLAQQELRAQIVAGTDSQDKYARSLAAVEAKNDPIAQANLNYANSYRELKNATYEATGATKVNAQAEDELKAKRDEAITAAKLKLAQDAAADSQAKSYLSTVASQAARLSELNQAVKAGRVSQEEYAAAALDAGNQIAKTAINTEAVTSGQLKYNLAVQASTEAAERADRAKLTGDDRIKFLAETQVAQDDAARTADTLKTRVDALAGAYSPVISITKKYADQLSEIDSLERRRPDLAPELEAQKPLIAVQQKQDIDKSLVLPALDKSSIEAADTYNTTIAKLAKELKDQTISQNQANQAALEARQAYLAASQDFDGYTKAVIEGGKAMDGALTNLLEGIGRRGTTLRSIFEGLSKQLQASASQILLKNLESKAGSALQSSSSQGVRDFGTNLFGNGAGAKLKAEGVAGGDDHAATAAQPLSSAAADLSAAAEALNDAAGNLGGGGGGVSSFAAGAGGSASNDPDFLQSAQNALNEKDVGNLSQTSDSGNAIPQAVKEVAQTSSALAGHGGTSLSRELFGYAKQIGGMFVGGGGSGLSSAFSKGYGGSASSDPDLLNAAQSALDDQGVGSDLGFGMAGGGSVTGGSSHLVGETGPEVVSFGSNAHITPNEQVRAAVGAGSSKGQTVVSAPNVNVPVQVVNVSHPDDVPNAMSGAAGTKAIINVLSKNKTAVNSVLGN